MNPRKCGYPAPTDISSALSFLLDLSEFETFPSVYTRNCEIIGISAPWVDNGDRALGEWLNQRRLHYGSEARINNVPATTVWGTAASGTLACREYVTGLLPTQGTVGSDRPSLALTLRDGAVLSQQQTEALTLPVASTPTPLYLWRQPRQHGAILLHFYPSVAARPGGTFTLAGFSYAGHSHDAIPKGPVTCSVSYVTTTGITRTITFQLRLFTEDVGRLATVMLIPHTSFGTTTRFQPAIVAQSTSSLDGAPAGTYSISATLKHYGAHIGLSGTETYLFDEPCGVVLHGCPIAPANDQPSWPDALPQPCSYPGVGIIGAGMAAAGSASSGGGGSSAPSGTGSLSVVLASHRPPPSGVVEGGGDG